jgi:hypothetical protein
MWSSHSNDAAPYRHRANSRRATSGHLLSRRAATAVQLNRPPRIARTAGTAGSLRLTIGPAPGAAGAHCALGDKEGAVAFRGSSPAFVSAWASSVTALAWLPLVRYQSCGAPFFGASGHCPLANRTARTGRKAARAFGCRRQEFRREVSTLDVGVDLQVLVVKAGPARHSSSSRTGRCA